MINTFLSVVGLSIAGIDPVGAMLLFSAIVKGLERSKIILFTATVFVSTVATGVALALLGDHLSDEAATQPSAIWAYVEIAFALFIVVWIVNDLRGRNAEKKAKESRSLQGSSFVVFSIGLGWGVGAVLDPTFLGVVALAGRSDNPAAMIVGPIIWVLISQFMLFALFFAYLRGAHERLVERTLGFWNRHERPIKNMLYVLGGLLAGLLAYDAIYYFVNGSYSWE